MRRQWGMVGLVILALLGPWGCGGDSSSTPDSGQETVAGVDADANGVRDDVDGYIDQTYGDAGTRAALRQYARAVQVAMIDAGDAARSVTHASERFRAIECLMARRPNDFPEVFADLRATILNTNQRTQAYLQADDHVTAAVPPLLPADQWPSACVNP